MRFASVFLVFNLLPLIAAAQSGSGFSFEVQAGPNPVGLKVIEQYDYSRTFQPLIDDLGKPYQGERARPLQTLIWYPAQRNSGKPVTFGDYFYLRKTETSFGKPQVSIGFFYDMFMAGNNPGQPMWAVRNAPLAPGRFPVVVYAPSFSSSSWENADLCEYLASQGYVVIASPGMGVTHESTHDLAGVDAQARDISFLIGYAQTLSDTDLSEVAVIGFSWGGLSNLFAAARDNRIGALVDLDGSIRYWPGLVRKSEDVHPEQMTLPMLFFTSQSTIDSQDQLEASYPSAEGSSVLNAYTHGDFIRVAMLGLVHPQFNSVTQRSNWYFEHEFPGAQQGDYDRSDGIVGYAWVARYTREFLDAYLKHDAQAFKYLKNTPSENGVPPHVMGVKFRDAAPMPASLDSFKVELGRQGFDRAAQVYASIQKREPDFKLDTNALISWGYALLVAGHLPESIAIMKLNAQLFPSGDAFVGLGEAYMMSGQMKAAIESYNKALEKTPDNVAFKQRLDVLEASRLLRK